MARTSRCRRPTPSGTTSRRWPISAWKRPDARSIKWAAQKGLNGVMIVEPNDRLRKNIDIYYEEAEKAGWPDMHGRGRFKYGWDAAKRRGIMTSRYIHITTPGKEKQALERAARAMELQF